MFSVNDRHHLYHHIISRAKNDHRITAGAVIGSLATSKDDQWSDLDLTFGVADDIALEEVLEDFTVHLRQKFKATSLFDIQSGAAIYRVFLLPDCLQCDLSFAPASQWGARGPEFKLLFGEATKLSQSDSPPAQQLLGYAVHHALKARFCLERGHYWQAEYWVSAVRDYALSLACQRRGLPAQYGRGFDELPHDIQTTAAHALPASLNHEELQRALSCAIDLLLEESKEAQELADCIRPQLQQLAQKTMT